MQMIKQIEHKDKDKLWNKRRYSKYVYFFKSLEPRLWKEFLQLSNKTIQ